MDQFVNHGLKRLAENDDEYVKIKNDLVANLDIDIEVVGIHRANKEYGLNMVRVLSFAIYEDLMEQLRGKGKANVKQLWCSTSARPNEVPTIFCQGFHDHKGRFWNQSFFGCGMSLMPYHLPRKCVVDSGIGADGLQHIILSNVILGNVESLRVGSVLCGPSSDTFDSGFVDVDNSYIVWSTHTNSHILPRFVVSFKGLHPIWPDREDVYAGMLYPDEAFINLLYRQTKNNMIYEYFRQFKEGNITRAALEGHISQVVGERKYKWALKNLRAGALCFHREGGEWEKKMTVCTSMASKKLKFSLLQKPKRTSNTELCLFK